MTPEECARIGAHLKSVDDNGFCNACGHQEQPVKSTTPVDLVRLREHAKAAVSLTEAKASYHAADVREALLSVGEHPDALADAAEDVERAAQVLAAARAVERRAFISYTNPFGVEKTVGMG